MTATKNREKSEFARVKIRSGMAVSDFLFDNDADAAAFFEAAKKIHRVNAAHDKCAMYPVGHDITEPWSF